MHADHRPLARHPRRADHLRPQARRTPMRNSPAPATRLERGAQGSRDLRDFRRGRHLRPGRSARRSLCGEEDGARGRAGLDADHPARPPRHVFRDARRGRAPRSSGWRPKSATCSAPKCWKRRSSSPTGQKGSSAMPHKRNPVLSENLTGLARMVRGYVAAGAGERGALARARYFAFLGRAHDRAGRDGDARLRARPPRRRSSTSSWSIPRTCRRTSTASAGSIHSQRVLLALTQKGVAREDAYRLVQRNAMKAVGRRGRFPRAAEGRPGRAQAFERRRTRRQFRPRLPLRATSTRSFAACSAGPERRLHRYSRQLYSV